MSASAGGELVDVYLVDQMAAAELMARAMLGDAEAAQLFGAFWKPASDRQRPTTFAHNLRHLPEANSPRHARPRTDRPSSAIGFAICPRRAANRAGLLSRASESLQQIWPDLRPITITHPGRGHA